MSLERTDKVLLEQAPRAFAGFVIGLVLVIGGFLAALPVLFGVLFLVFICIAFPPVLLFVVPGAMYVSYALIRGKPRS